MADRYGGSFVDVARLAVPARHARAEAAPGRRDGRRPSGSARDQRVVALHRRRRRFLHAVGGGEAGPRGLDGAAGRGLAAAHRRGDAGRAGQPGAARSPWCPTPATWPASTPRSTAVLGRDRHVTLTADLGPSTRYSRWLAVRRGQVLAVAGTRAAAYAPVADPGLFVIWDDGDDLHREPRAPYPDTRDVLALRASHTGAALLIAGHVRSTQAQQLVESGWAHAIAAERALRARAGAAGARDR